MNMASKPDMLHSGLRLHPRLTHRFSSIDVLSETSWTCNDATYTTPATHRQPNSQSPTPHNPSVTYIPRWLLSLVHNRYSRMNGSRVVVYITDDQIASLMLRHRDTPHLSPHAPMSSSIDSCINEHDATLLSLYSDQIEQLRTLETVLPACVGDINAVDADGQTPLHVAAALGRADIVKLLLSQPDIVSVDSKLGVTALSLPSRRMMLSEITTVVPLSRWPKVHKWHKSCKAS